MPDNSTYNVKDGAKLDNVHKDVMIALIDTITPYWRAYFPEDKDGLTVTSGCEGQPGDGVHGNNSKHYPANCASTHGEAIDIRLNDVLQWKATVFCGDLFHELERRYPNKFILFAEGILKPSAHCHIQLR